MRHHVLRWLVLAVAAVVVASGCAVPAREYAAKRHYVLEAARAGRTQAAAAAPVVKVRRFAVSDRFAGTGFVYRTGDVTVESDFYNEFFVPPASLVTEAAQTWLAASGIFSHVGSGGSGPDAAYTLEGEVGTLLGDFSDAAQPKAVLALSLVLINEEGDERA